MRLVLDASAAVNALVPGHLHDATMRRLEDGELLAPDLIDIEVISALARLERGDAITTAEADRAVTAWQRLPCTRVSVEALLPEIWALRRSIRISDAHYVVLAGVLSAPLLTADQRVARAGLPGLSVLTIS
ncbi:MAG: type II toxin-antitoxin system VapC family toxin [Ornithinimicrobium sp.]|uniref:type II toxin-antitoxin system VapC family toxin n=1 Tax=Ornithinimicrobium sp. TaxID=1977084 RepID=UPI0026E0AED5|nr:type II toxin-antitoxin system VapC family toxin [Ornithinimicrobium sp.]MDO5738734.1 type II toxin-antitoxin system VapC family toxin [Ornithinimicrobium sp.]